MISFALLTGIFAYSIFFLGIGRELSVHSLISVTSLYIIFLLILLIRKRESILLPFPRLTPLLWSVLFLLTLFFCCNLIGALGPEYSFDALWYHLTLPKLYLLNHRIFYIPGGVFYYSTMPKLAEMLFIPSLAFSSEIIAKLTQFFFGILICIVLYQTSRKYYARHISLLLVLVFYSNIVVSWESTVAYIDLIRTFYEFLALVVFLRWQKEQRIILLLLSGVVLGFGITTKLLALGTLFLLSLLVFFICFDNEKSFYSSLKKVVLFIMVALLVPLPWFIFSSLATGNPVFPFLTPVYPTHVSLGLLNPFTFMIDIFSIFTHAADPISPIYLIVIPLVFILFRSFSTTMKIVTMYCLGTFLIWYIIPRTGGGRFMLPYLPAFTLVIGEVLTILEKQKRNVFYYKTLIGMIFLIAVSSLIYRGFAVSKYIPYLLGKETKQTFLINHLTFSFGDFYDIDHQIAKKMTKRDVVLLFGFHNLYYIDFPFIDSSYVQKGDRFTYIATQNTLFPKEYANAQIVYEEKRTGVTLYKVGERRWGK